jgi:hypothetical protein
MNNIFIFSLENPDQLFPKLSSQGREADHSPDLVRNGSVLPILPQAAMFCRLVVANFHLYLSIK